MKFSFECTVFLTWLLTICTGVDSESDASKSKCKFHNDAVVPKGFEKLKELVGHTFHVPRKQGDKSYMYNVGICTDDVKDTFADAAVVQIDTSQPKSDPQVIGKYEESSILSGANWVLLQYLNSDKIDLKCNREPVKTMILFTCDPAATFESAVMTFITGGKDGCYYLFQMPHSSVCDVQTSSSLSIGSIILIVFFCVAAVYLIAGGLYQRFVMGSKGVEQIPNYEFWKDFGNLQADGCDFVCRTHDSRRSSPYKGLGDDQLDEPEERDDNLLPM